jgi:hypothetical protein
MKFLTTIILLTFLNVTAMAKEIKTEILINATPEKVWLILTSFINYPNWNPFIKTIQGEVKIGNKIKVKIQPPNSKVMTVYSGQYDPSFRDIDPPYNASDISKSVMTG